MQRSIIHKTEWSYTIGVSSKQYRFASRSIELTDTLTDVDFTGLD